MIYMSNNCKVPNAIIHRLSKNSTKVNPLCLIIDFRVPMGIVLAAWNGTVTRFDPFLNRIWFPDVRTLENPWAKRIDSTSLALSEGNFDILS